MAYQDIGYDEFLNRVDPIMMQSPSLQELDPQQFDSFTQQISGNKIDGGIISSPDGSLKFDVANGTFYVNNGNVNIMQFGKLPDGSIGLLIKDGNGNTIMQFSNNIATIQSSTGRFVTDYILEQFILKDDNDVPIGLWGKQVGGF